VTVIRTQLAGLLRRPVQLLLTGLALIVASFVVFGTILAHQITETTIVDSLSATPVVADLVVGGVDAGAPPTTDALRKIRALPGVAEATGRLSVDCQVRRGSGSQLEVAADPGSGPLATVRTVRGHYPKAGNEVALTERTATRFGLTVGDTMELLGGPDPGEAVTFTVTGVVDDAHDSGQRAYATDATTSHLGGGTSLTQIDVRLAPGTDADQVRPSIVATASRPSAPGALVRTGTQARSDEAHAAVNNLGGLFALVSMFVAIAVVAAVLVATSTFRIVFAQRMRQFALLRAVGAGRGSLARALVGEGALTGLVAGTVGVAAALAVGHALPPVLHSAGVRLSQPGFPVGPAVAVIVGAMLVAVLAVLAPAFSAARVAPLEALRAASTTAGRTGIGAVRATAGVLMTGAAALVAAGVVAKLPHPDQTNYDPTPVLLAIVLSGALAFVALVALGPVLVGPVLRLVGWPLRRIGPVGRLAVGGVGGAARRAGAVTVVVALGVTLVAGVLVGAASLNTMARQELASSAPGDFWLRADTGQTLPAKAVDRVGHNPQLKTVVPYRQADIQVGQAAMQVEAADLDLRRVSTWHQLGTADGSLAHLGPGRTVLARVVANSIGVRPGDAVTLRRGDNTVTVRLAAIMNSTPLTSPVLVDPVDLTRLGVPAGYSGLLADAAHPGESGRTAARKALLASTSDADKTLLDILADRRDELRSTLDQILAIALGLIGLTVIIAVVGVGTTTALSVVERIRESGLLRAIGMSRAGLWTMLTTEAGLYGVIGATMGLLLALPYAWLSVRALGEEIPVELPVPQLVGVVVVLAALTALAGVLPARRAARVSPMSAIGNDA
jgi:putative ABC transport system permease protein